MKKIRCLRLALSGAIAIITHSTFAQAWQTVTDFQYAAGKNAYATGLAKDPMGNVYAVGAAQDSVGAWHAMAMKSGPGGTTWSNIDDYSFPGGTPSYGAGYDAGIAADGAGNLYAAGYNDGFSGHSAHWFVRRSVAGGLTWSTSDNFTFGSGAQPRALTTDASGNVYVAGQGTSGGTNYWIVRKGTKNVDGSISWSTVNVYQQSSDAWGCFSHPTAGLFVAGHAPVYGADQWIVRRRIDGGTTWATVDAYQLDSTNDANAYGIGADASGNIYVVGHAGQPLHWTVRKSMDGGSSWATVDDFITLTFNTIARGFAADAFGNLFVIGQHEDSDATHWLVRKNPDGVGTWASADDFQYASGQHAVGRGLVADGSGNVFGSGYGKDAAGVQHWIVRKLAAPPRSILTNLAKLGNGAFQFSFTNANDTSFTVLATTNLSLPSANWTAIDSPVPVGDGIYQFTDSTATNYSQRFYKLRSP